MRNKNAVISDLEHCCGEYRQKDVDHCEGCWYEDYFPVDGICCIEKLMQDALELLKEKKK